MAWNGSGTYNKGNLGTGGWVGDAAANIPIQASRHDTQDNDFAAGINNCLAKDGQNAMTGDLNMGLQKIKNLALGTAAAPAIYPDADTNTGIFSPGADSLAISAGGTERIRVNTTDIAVNNLKITGVATPTGSTDVATKGYADSVITTGLDGDKGDITVSASGATWTIDNGAVTLDKQANVATGTVFYRKTAGTGAPEVQTLATLKTDLDLSGTNTGDQTITLTGDVTGTGTNSFAATIAAGAVTLAKQANVATGTVFYRKTAGTGAPEVQTLATLKTDLGLTGTNSGDQTITLTGDVTGTGTGSFAATIAANAVTTTKISNSNITYAKIQNVSVTDRLLGRATAGAGVVEEIVCTAAGRALIDDVDAAAQRTTLGLTAMATQSGTALTSLNSQTGATQTFTPGTGGTDFGISSSGNIHTFNLPTASATARGAVSTGAQTFAGAKTFSNEIDIATSGPSNFNDNQNCSVRLSTAANKCLRIDSSTDSSYLAAIDNSLIISQNRNPYSGSFANTGAAQCDIRLFGANADSYITFITNNANNQQGSERVRITKEGRVGIGTTGPTYQLQLSSDSAAKPATNTWTTTSDARLKTNIIDADTSRCYDIIKSLPLKRYTWRDDVYTPEQVSDRSKLGWIAQDVESIFPKAVTQNEMIVNGEKINDCRYLNADQLYAAMYGAIQKLIEKVESLELEVAALKGA